MHICSRYLPRLIKHLDKISIFKEVFEVRHKYSVAGCISKLSSGPFEMW